MPHGYQSRNHDQRGGSGNRNRGPALDLSKVRIKSGAGNSLDPELFNTIAEDIAKTIGENQRENKPSQIRRFYDELVMWEERTRQAPERFAEYLPFIRMLNAKAAYAKGRKHVDQNFVAMISHCLQQVDDIASLRNFKIFFEAFLGFYKLYGPKG